MKKLIVGRTTLKGDQSHRVHIAVLESNMQKVIATTGYDGAPDEEESLDNAFLIASLPELIAASQQALEYLESISTTSRAATRLRKALNAGKREDMRHREEVSGVMAGVSAVEEIKG